MKTFLINIKDILVFILKIDSSLPVILIPLVLLQALQPFVPIVFLSLILDALDAGKSLTAVGTLIVIMLLSSAVLSQAISFLNTCKQSRFDIIQKETSKEIGKLALSIDYAIFQENAVCDLFAMAKDSQQLVGIFNNLTSMVSVLLTIFGAISVILTIHPLLLLFMAVVLAVRIWKNQKAIRLFEKWRPVIAPMLRKRNYLNLISMQDIKYGKEVRLFNLASWLNQIYQENSEEIDQNAVERNVEAEKQEALPGIFEILQVLCIYLYMAYRVIFTEANIGYYSLAINSALTFSQNLLKLVDVLIDMGVYNTYIADLAKLIELHNNSNINKPGGCIVEKTRKIEIEFRNVSFKYPHAENYVFKSLNLHVVSPQSIAIVGENGAGKTTLIKLLLRLYVPDEGHIYFNGKDIQDLDYSSYLDLIAVVFQDYKTYAFSIKENVVCGQQDADEERLANAYAFSGIQKKIDELKNGQYTVLRRDYDEEGVEISGGEEQKVAVARAYYKDTPLVILDEPTATLDPIAEYKLYKNMEAIKKDKLAIFVTHRLASTKFCDKIIVLASGRVIEEGTHDDLIKKKGLYAEMYEKQAYYYSSGN